MEEEFNLSEKRIMAEDGTDVVYYGKDIKELIKRLKEVFDTRYDTLIIDKLAGEELNGKN